MTAFLAPAHLIHVFGLAGMMAVLFAECGLLVGVVLPGDSLLVTGGLLVAEGLLAPLWVVLLLLPVPAIAGNLVGWWIGHTAGPAVLERPAGSRLVPPRRVRRARAFFARHGGRTVVLARFVPVVRTFTAVLAGAARMDLRRFALYSVIGGVAWTVGGTMLGFWLGHVRLVRDHVELVVLAVVVLSTIPAVVESRRARRAT